MKKLILYGAGTVGKGMAIELTYQGVQIECFCDRDQKKCGKDYAGYKVKTIDEIKDSYPVGSFQILITVSRGTVNDVKKDLLDNKIFSISDFYDEEEDPLEIMRFFMIASPDYDISFSIPWELKENFCYLDEKNEKNLRDELLSHYFHVSCYDDLPFGYARKDFSDHLFGRLELDRKRVIPWLNSIYKLEGASILEIGCGTGASTVALCEQKAYVTAIDADASSIELANIRMNAYGLKANIMHINAADILEALPDKRYDFIIFFASLEHMTFEERIKSLRAAFQMLNENGSVVLAEIPNRLWYIDLHTSYDPFYNWLPDSLAMEYSKFTLREEFNKGFDPSNEQDVLRFTRWGRGVSYHEIWIALGCRNRICVTSCLSSFLNFPESTFKKFLKMSGPQDMHEGFYDPYLYIALKLENERNRLTYD